MSPFIIAYLAVVIPMLLIAWFLLIEASFKEKKIASRILILAPVWPVLAPIFLWKGFRWCWKHADWRGAEEEEYEEKIRRVRGNW